MKFSMSEVEDLLPGYLSGDLSENERTMIDEWRKDSPENESVYLEYCKAWEAIPLLNEMEKFNSFDALKKVNKRLIKTNFSGLWTIIQRVAAILLLPVLVYSGYQTLKNLSLKKQNEEQVVMQTISSRQGMVSEFSLPDGTEVWLNSGSELQFPIRFPRDIREVTLKGEAFFEVAKNVRQPFRVNAKDLNIDVLGTSFNVINYDNETQSEVILIEGKVKLSAEEGQVTKEYGTMHPGQRAVYKEEFHNVSTEEVNPEKYIAWRDGNLIFQDDSMEDVVKRLSRWFNVEIIIEDPEINEYIYKATFRNENLKQVLNLLKISAPIDYRIIESKVLPDGEFTKQKIYLMKKNK
jgi:transmembrane sensor